MKSVPCTTLELPDALSQTHGDGSSHTGSAACDLFAALSARHYNCTQHAGACSPITGSPNIILERQIAADFIAAGYSQKFKLNVKKYFNGVPSISVYRCLDTGYRFFYPFNLSGDSGFYEALEKLPWYYMEWKWEHETAQQIIAPRERVLEIGCGNCSFVQKMSSQGIDISGLELNDASVRKGKEAGLAVFKEDITAFSVRRPEYYDVVCAFQVIEHVALVKEFMHSAIDVLKPGGRLLLSVPNHDSFMGLDEHNWLDMPPHHMGLWSEASLKNIAKAFNMKLHKLYIEPLQQYHVDYYLHIMRGSLHDEFGLHAQLEHIVRTSSNSIKGFTVLAEYIKN